MNSELLQTSIKSYNGKAISICNGKYVLLGGIGEKSLYEKKDGSFCKVMKYDEEIYASSDIAEKKIYLLSTADGSLIIDVVPEMKRLSYGVSSTAECVVDSVIGERYLIVHTVEDTDLEQQISRYYIIDIKNNCLAVSRQPLVNSSYHMPYILNDDGDYFAIESSFVFPYELDEATNESSILNNDLLIIAASEYMGSCLRGEKVQWDVIATNNKREKYLQVMCSTIDSLLYIDVDIYKEYSSLYEYCLDGKKSTHVCDYPTIIDGITTGTDGEVYAYKWFEDLSQIDVYKADGNLFEVIKYRNSDYIELHEIVGIIKKKYIVFEATEFDDSYDSIQTRVVYDVIEKKYQNLNCSLVEYEGRVY